MKYGDKVDSVVEIILCNKIEIATHIWTIKFLVDRGGSCAPKNPLSRLAWDLARVRGIIEIINEIQDSGEDWKDSHIENMLIKAIQKSNIINFAKNIEEEVRGEAKAESDRIFDRHEKYERELKELKRKHEEARIEADRKNEEAKKKEDENVVNIKQMYKGYMDSMCDADVNKVHTKLSKQVKFEDKVMTYKVMVEYLINEFGGFPVYNKKMKVAKYFIEYPNLNENNMVSSIAVGVDKEVYLYGVYLHGEKEYEIEVSMHGKNIKNKYRAMNYREALEKACEKMGINNNDLHWFTSSLGYTAGTLDDSIEILIRTYKTDGKIRVGR